jgi:hypothetical protein
MWKCVKKEEESHTEPASIAMDPMTGNIYVLDIYTSFIQVYTCMGVFIRTWGVEGMDLGQFDHPKCISIRNDFIYTIDHANDSMYDTRIQCFDLQGTFSHECKEFTSKSVRSIHILLNHEHVWIADEGNQCIHQYRIDGAHVKTFGNQNKKVHWVGFMAKSLDGKRLYIVDDFNNQIHVLNL